MNIALNWLRVCSVAALLALSGVIYTAGVAVAQEGAKQKAQKAKEPPPSAEAAKQREPPPLAEAAKQRIECWVKCCWEIGCRWGSASAARKADTDAQVIVTGKLLAAEFKPTGDQKTFEVKQETKLDAETASALGFKEVTMMPGQYPITKLDSGKAKVTIKVKTLPKTGYDLKENKGKAIN